jgi:hypothetical protein
MNQTTGLNGQFHCDVPAKEAMNPLNQHFEDNILGLFQHISSLVDSFMSRPM